MRTQRFAIGALTFVVALTATGFFLATSRANPASAYTTGAQELPPTGLPTHITQTAISPPTHQPPHSLHPLPSRIRASLIYPYPVTTAPSAPVSPSMPASPSTSPSPSASPSPSRTPTVPPVHPTAPRGGPVPAPVPTTTRIVQLGTVNGKQVLVDQTGRTLYLFTGDTTTVSTCNGACATTWPPLAAPARAGTGVDPSKLMTSTRTDGSLQMTYFGHPLYYFAGDQQPGQAHGEGIGGTFFMVNAQGQPVTS